MMGEAAAKEGVLYRFRYAVFAIERHSSPDETKLKVQLCENWVPQYEQALQSFPLKGLARAEWAELGHCLSVSGISAFHFWKTG
jgi:hypothetical protein